MAGFMVPARLLALVLVAVGLGAAVVAWSSMPLGEPGSPGPGLFPLALGLATAALAGATLFQTPPAGAPVTAGRRVAVVAALLVLFPLLLSRAGFGLTAALELFLLGRAVSSVGSGRLAVFALTAASAGVLLFRHLLALPLPAGPWGF